MNSVGVSSMRRRPPVDLVALLVEAQVAHAHAAVVAFAVGPPQDGAHPDDELLHAEGLGHVVVAAQGEAPQLVVEGVARREEQHGQPPADAVPAHALEDVEPAQVGEHDVEDDEVGAELGHRLEGVAAQVRHLDLHALVAQGHGQQVGDAGLVVDDQDAGGLGHGDRS